MTCSTLKDTEAHRKNLEQEGALVFSVGSVISVLPSYSYGEKLVSGKE